MKKAILAIFSFLIFSLIHAQPDTTQKIIAGRKNSLEQQKKPYVILISADGFRYDYAEKYKAKTLLSLGKKGIRANSMIPSYPSLTFPNHYTIVTGMYPSHHGLVNNYFYDPAKKASYSMRNAETVKDGSWYGGTPLWVLAEQQKLLTASFYWVGSEADIQGVLPTYYYSYNEEINIDRRIQIVIEWLQLPEEKRPHLITFYFPEVDHEGHSSGPDDPATANKVRWLDSCIHKLTNAVKVTGLPVNFILISDHGMTNVDTDNTIGMPPAVDTSRFIIPRGSELLELYAKNKEDIIPTYEKLKEEEKYFKAYLKSEVPERLNYGVKDDKYNRIGDILLFPVWPKIFHFSSGKANPGAHGFDPDLVKDMHATFFAWGPAFKKGLNVPSFENVNVFPVIARILDLKYSNAIDGTNELADSILK